MPADILKTISDILDRGNSAEIKRRKGGEIIVLEVRKQIKKAVSQTGDIGGQAGP